MARAPIALLLTPTGTKAVGVLKTTERWFKRRFIRIVTQVVRTPRVPVETVLATPPKRVLVVRQHHQMGDMLLSVPAYRAIYEAFPDAHIAVMSAPINRDVLCNPFVSEVFTFTGFSPFRFVPLIRRVRRRRFDLCIVQHTMSFSFTSALIGRLSGARFRVGSTSRPFGHDLARAFYHVELPLPDEATLAGMNEAEHNLVPLRALGIDTKDLTPVLVPPAESERWADAFVARECAGPGALVAVHPGAGKAGNIWPAVNFAETVNRLCEDRPLQVLVIEGPRDRDTVDRFRRALHVDTIVLRGRSIVDVAAVLRRMHLVLCNDTGVMHVACAVGAHTLSIFGPTDPVRWAPRCDNLHIVRAPGGRLVALDPLTVYEAARGRLEAGSGTAGPVNQ